MIIVVTGARAALLARVSGPHGCSELVARILVYNEAWA